MTISCFTLETGQYGKKSAIPFPEQQAKRIDIEILIMIHEDPGFRAIMQQLGVEVRNLATL
jgi:hypothetical protein